LAICLLHIDPKIEPSAAEPPQELGRTDSNVGEDLQVSRNEAIPLGVQVVTLLVN